MGYRPEFKVFRLVFKDGEYEGLVVRARSLSTGAYLKILPAFDAAESKTVGGMSANTETLMLELAECLMSWNIEDESGQPLPPTMESLRSLELPLVMDILRAWIQGMASVPDPLDGRSTSGGISAVESLPMEMS